MGVETGKPVSEIAYANYTLQATAKEEDAMPSLRCWDSECRLCESEQSSDSLR